MFETVLLVLIASLGLRFEAGYAGYYAPGVMRDVVRVRQAGWTANPLPEELPPHVGYIATRNEEDIGRLACLWYQSEGWRCGYLVADVCNEVAGHCRRMERLGIACDVDYNTARRWGVVGRGGTGEAAIKIRIMMMGDIAP